MEVIKLPIIIEREKELKYVVVAAKYNKEWIYVRHKDRDTWEMPGGHIEKDESIHEAAGRELYEESGALTFNLYDVCDYAVSRGSDKSFGRLLFANVKELGELPDSEIAEVMLSCYPEKWTYKEIQPILFEMVKDWRRTND